MQCDFIKENKEVCKAKALKSDTKCYAHSSKISEAEKNIYRSSGGKQKQLKVYSEFDNYELSNIDDVLKLNTVLINSVLQNKVDLKIATGICYLLNMQVKCLDIQITRDKELEDENFVNGGY